VRSIADALCLLVVGFVSGYNWSGCNLVICIVCPYCAQFCRTFCTCCAARIPSWQGLTQCCDVYAHNTPLQVSTYQMVTDVDIRLLCSCSILS
jgi:hypothetical protein